MVSSSAVTFRVYRESLICLLLVCCILDTVIEVESSEGFQMFPYSVCYEGTITYIASRQGFLYSKVRTVPRSKLDEGQYSN